jgi:CheY-like chemotaxis protein
VIDDERFIAELIRDVLRGKGFDVEMCAEAQEAAARAESGRFDLVVSDYAMPGLNGLEFTRRVHAKSPQTKVLIVSAYLDGETVDLLEAEPCFAGYLRKPFDIFQLVAMTERLLDRTVERPSEIATAAPNLKTAPRRALPFQGGFGNGAPRS